jgi:hypothetical protein
VTAPWVHLMRSELTGEVMSDIAGETPVPDPRLPGPEPIPPDPEPPIPREPEPVPR